MADPLPAQPIAPIAPGNKPATVTSVPLLKTLPFPKPAPSPFAGSQRQNQRQRLQAKLQGALNAAILAGPGTSWRTPICIVALPNTNGTGPPCVLASFRPIENHYTASLAKIHAMYAAFQLRETLRAIAAELGPNAAPATVIPTARAYLNPLIMAQAGPLLARAPLDPRSKNPVTLANRLPSYTGFEAATTGSGVTVNFTGAYQQLLNDMITVSSDPAAGQCIHNIGYAYLNGALASAGFFDATSQNGLWLAADYSDFKDWGALTIDTVNDGQASAVATVVQMASLLTQIYLIGGLFYTGTVKDQPDPANPTATANGRARQGMLDLLRKTGSWLTANKTVGFQRFGAKVGLGELKDKTTSVMSEGAILTHTRSARRFVAVWQNFVWGGIDPVARVIDSTLNAFLS